MNKEQLEQEIKNIFDRNCQEVLVLNKRTFWLRKPYIAVKVANQYKEIDLTVDRLQKISDLFGTEDIDFNPYSDETSEGCDSCGHGSAYFSEIKIFNSKVKV